MRKDVEKDKLAWWEFKFLPIVTIVLMVFGGVGWGWEAVMLILLLAFIAEKFIGEAKHVKQIKALGEDIEWLKERLRVVDPKAAADFAAATPDNPCLQPPSDEIVGSCPKCGHTTKRRELGLNYNGGYR